MIRIDQRENAEGDFWYTIRGGNGENTATSKMYRERWRAVRAARAMIAAVAPAEVVFRHYSGSPTPLAMRAGARRSRDYRRITERIRAAS